MRKHDVRKWLHAILDLLPVILIPVFMIYSHRHEINSGSIEIPQTLAIDFNQQVQNGDFSDGSNYWGTSGNASFSVNDNICSFVVTSQYGRVNQNVTFVPGHKYLSKVSIKTPTPTTDIALQLAVGDTRKNVKTTATTSWQEIGFVASPFLVDGVGFVQIQDNRASDWDSVQFSNVMLFDLTQMFGVGNEPTTLQEFNILFPDSYYDFTLSHKELINNGSITYNDTDIMSQFTYQLYNCVDKYFNMGNVFHLNEVYDWFNLNIFNGQAPIYIFIVYQIVLYELIMDLLMLLYALFMWFIDMIEKLMEKPLNSIK